MSKNYIYWHKLRFYFLEYLGVAFLKINEVTGGRWDWSYRAANFLFGCATSSGILGGIYVINPEFRLYKDGSQPMLILAKDLENVKSKERTL